MRIEREETISRLSVVVDKDTALSVPHHSDASLPRDTYEILVREVFPGTDAVLIREISRDQLKALGQQILSELMR